MNDLERLESKYLPLSDGCWLWVAGLFSNGYGQFKLAGKGVGAHRASYELYVGPIPPGLTIDHLCRVKQCVNPEHLEVVTIQENIRRAKALITHCPAGHPHTPENTWYRQNGARICKPCRLTLQRSEAHGAYVRQWYAKTSRNSRGETQPNPEKEIV